MTNSHLWDIVTWFLWWFVLICEWRLITPNEMWTRNQPWTWGRVYPCQTKGFETSNWRCLEIYRRVDDPKWARGFRSLGSFSIGALAHVNTLMIYPKTNTCCASKKNRRVTAKPKVAIFQFPIFQIHEFLRDFRPEICVQGASGTRTIEVLALRTRGVPPWNNSPPGGRLRSEKKVWHGKGDKEIDNMYGIKVYDMWIYIGWYDSRLAFIMIFEYFHAHANQSNMDMNWSAIQLKGSAKILTWVAGRMSHASKW